MTFLLLLGGVVVVNVVSIFEASHYPGIFDGRTLCSSQMMNCMSTLAVDHIIFCDYHNQIVCHDELQMSPGMLLFDWRWW